MNKVIGEFISSQQPYPQVVAKVVFQVGHGSKVMIIVNHMPWSMQVSGQRSWSQVMLQGKGHDTGRSQGKGHGHDILCFYRYRFSPISTSRDSRCWSETGWCCRCLTLPSVHQLPWRCGVSPASSSVRPSTHGYGLCILSLIPQSYSTARRRYVIVWTDFSRNLTIYMCIAYLFETQASESPQICNHRCCVSLPRVTSLFHAESMKTDYEYHGISNYFSRS